MLLERRVHALQQQAAERKRAHRAAVAAAAAGHDANGLSAPEAGPLAARAASSADAVAGRPAAKRARREPDPTEVGSSRRTEQRCATGQGLVTSAAAEPDLAEVAAARRAMQDFRGSFAGLTGSAGAERRAAAGQGLGDAAMRGSQSRAARSSARAPAGLEPLDGPDPVMMREDWRGRSHEAGYSNGVAAPAAGRLPAADDDGGSAGALSPQ